MRIGKLVRETVRSRAGCRCEYCRMHEDLQGGTFHVDHVDPRIKGGSDELENLAWCCPRCNSLKATKTHFKHPKTGQLVRLFHPRVDSWSDHFLWNGYRVVGITEIGRVTVDRLKLNEPRKIKIRRAEETFDLFPPE